MALSGNQALASGEARAHVVHELGFSVVRGGEHELLGTADVLPAMHVPGTSVLRASILATWADILSGLLAVDEVGPRVPVTLQLDLHLYAPPSGVTRVHATARRLKAGRSVFVAAVDFGDQEGRPLGTSTGLFVVAPDPEVLMPAGPSPVDVMREPGGPLQVPFAERVGCVRRRSGVAALPKRTDGLNASGTLNGGLLALVAEEAALSALPGTTLAMLTMRFLRAVRVGPAVASASVHGDLADVTVLDDGRGGALAVAVTARAFPAEPGAQGSTSEPVTVR